jgi:DNA-binding NarL/FixJ family response regulator
MENIRIALVDDQQLFREGIASIIELQPEFELLLEAENGQDFLLALEHADILPDIALVDMEMPVMDGIELNNQIQRLYPQIKVIILSMYTKERLMARMIHDGASGYLAKNCNKQELILALQTTYKTGFYMNMQVLKAMQHTSLQPHTLKNDNGVVIEISPREREVLQYICQEHTNGEIAEKLFINIRTVDGHRNNLLTKTGCRNTAGLVLFAIKHHIFEVIS